MSRNFLSLPMILVVAACGSDNPSPSTQFKTSAATTRQECRVTMSTDTVALGETIRIRVDFPNGSASGPTAFFPQALQYVQDPSSPVRFASDARLAIQERFVPIATPSSTQIFDIAYGLNQQTANQEARAFLQRPGSVIETFSLTNPTLGQCESKVRVYLSPSAAYAERWWKRQLGEPIR